ncbi:MAG: DUF72 domain-containing protein [Promethearchaeota archaeon]
MVKISIGTAGWDYKGWKGTFYPKKLDKQHYLNFYSNYFNVIEINSTFYNLPSKIMVNNWLSKVPDNFRFIIKVWQEITHNLEGNLNERLYQFFERFRPLKKKIFGFLFQFPPSFIYSKRHHDKLLSLTSQLPLDLEIRYIIELRDDSWFNPNNLADIIDGNRIILGTTYQPGIKPYYFQNQRYYYIRLIGDRELTTFGRIQREQRDSLDDLFKSINILQKSNQIYEIFIIVNNHFQGMAPQSANLIKEQLNLPIKYFNQQKSLEDYI